MSTSTSKKSTWKARLLSLFTAGAIFATSLPWFQSGIGENLAVVVHVWAWCIVLLSLVVMTLVGGGTILLLWFSGELDWDEDREKFEKAATELSDVKPKLYWSLPFTAMWIFAIASTPWTGLLGTYVVSSLITYVVVYWLFKSLRTTMEKLKAEWEAEEDSDKPEVLRKLRKY